VRGAALGRCAGVPCPCWVALVANGSWSIPHSHESHPRSLAVGVGITGYGGGCRPVAERALCISPPLLDVCEAISSTLPNVIITAACRRGTASALAPAPYLTSLTNSWAVAGELWGFCPVTRLPSACT